MTDSFFLFLFFCMLVPIMLVTYGVPKTAPKSNFVRSWGPLLILFTTFFGMAIPMVALRLYILPNYATYNTYDAMMMEEVEVSDGEVHQILTYEDGTEINLTEKTGKYYTEMPDTQYETEQLTFLWVINWDNGWYSGLDFIKRN